MHRRTFVKTSSLLALSIGVFGRIEYANGAFIGDTPTTTDVLGPFYRPNAPLRTNINPAGFNGTPLHLSGVIYKEDGKTLFKNCLVEMWQCNHEGVYDLLSDDYIYRSAAKVGKDHSAFSSYVKIIEFVVAGYPISNLKIVRNIIEKIFVVVDSNKRNNIICKQ